MLHVWQLSVSISHATVLPYSLRKEYGCPPMAFGDRATWNSLSKDAAIGRLRVHGMYRLELYIDMLEP